MRVVLSPASVTLTAGQTQSFTTQAFDQFNTPVTAPVRFVSSDTSVVTVNDAGLATARPRRASGFIIAKLYSDQADTSSVSVVLPAARVAAFSGGAQSASAGTALSQNVVVLVTAADSVPVPGVGVTFAASGGGTPGATTVNTNATGFASTTWTLGNIVGAQSMTATVAGLIGSPVTFTATATPGVPAALAVTTQPTATVAGQSIAPSIVIEVRTAGGVRAVGSTDSVTIAIASNPGGATPGGTRTVAAVNGIATFGTLTLDRVGAGYTLVASSGALTAATSTSFAVTAAAATALQFTVQPAGGIPGVALAPPLAVRALDAFGNAATFTGNVTITLGANPGGTTLGGTITRGAVANVATFNDLTLGATGSGYTLVAAATGLTGVTSDPFNIGAQTIAWASPTSGNWRVAANWNLNRVPNAADLVDISLSGTYTVTLDVNTNVAGIQVGTSEGGTQTLAMNGRTLTLAGNVQVGTRGALSVTTSSVVGTGTVVNAGTITLSGSSIALGLDNQGLLISSATSSITGALMTSVGSVLRIGAVDGSGTATLTVANGFTNNGAIELTVTFAAAYGAQLTVTSGTLVNAVGGTITTLDGTVGGGTRTIAAQLDNQGTLTVGPGTAGRLTVTGSLTNSGTIDLELGGTTAATQFDQIVVGGTPSSATLGGTLNVSLINGFTPASLNSFLVLTTGTGVLSGAFSARMLPGGITDPPTYTGSGVTLVAP